MKLIKFIKSKSMTIILIGSIIVVLGGILTAFGTYILNKKNSETANKIETNVIQSVELGEVTVENTQELKEQNELQAKTIDSLRKENTDLHFKLAKISTDIYQNLTGGDSYCVIEVFFDALSGTPDFSIRHIGDIPLRNVSISIEDLERRVFLINKMTNNDYKSPLITEIIDKTFYGFNYNAVHPNTSVNLPIPVEKDQEHLRFRIWIYLENGGLFETLEIKDFKNKEKRKYKLILKRGDEELINKS